MGFGRCVLSAACWIVALALPGAVLADGSVGGGQGAVRLAVLNGSADKASAGSAVVLAELAKAFEAVDGLTVLDRDAIAKVLAEHRLSAMGVIRRPVERGRMLGAAYLLYAQAPRLSSGRKLAMLCVEVSSGNVLWERGLDLDAVGDPEAASPAIAALAREASAAIAANEARLDRPTATVLAVTNRSRSHRLDFLADSLNGTLEDLLTERGYRVLRRRNPGLLMKETTLGVSGMVRPDAAVLAEAADLVVAASFTEHPSGDEAFRQTPIRLTLELRPRGKDTRAKTLAFTLATLAKLAVDLRSALPAVGATGGAASAPADKDVSRRIEAARLMAELKDLNYGASLPEHRRQIELARRVIYLDPSAKEAYYRLGISLDALTRQTRGRNGTHEGSSQDTADAMAAYLRFPRTNEEHVHWAFSNLMVHVSGLNNKEMPAKTVPIVKEYIRWRREQDATHRSKAGRWAELCLEDCWADDPAASLEFYTWLDEFYGKKGFESMYPVARAHACDELGRADEAAEFLYYGLVTKPIPQQSLLNHWTYKRWWKQHRPEALAKRLDPERSKALLAQIRRCCPTQPEHSGPITYEQALGSSSALWDYRSHADDDRLSKTAYTTVEGERVPVDRSVVLAVIIRRTPSGLWMQAGTDDGKLALFHCADGKAWRAVSVPPALAEARPLDGVANATSRVNSIVQVGEELLVATSREGLFVRDLRTCTWRHYGTAEGLPGKTISQMTPAPDGKSALLASEEFLCRYRGGKLFLSRARIDRFFGGMVPWTGRVLMIFGSDSEERLVAVDPDAARVTTLLSAAAARGLLPAPANVWLPGRYCNPGVFTWQRLAVLRGRAYYAGAHGLIELGPEGKAVKLWRPDGFVGSGSLGGWVKGNCALPPCTLVEVLPDDRDAHRLWLVSKWNDSTPYTFAYACFPKQSWSHFLGDDSRAACFITAFDTKTCRFSKPIRTKRSFAHAQPFGDYVYVTGRVPSRLAKSLWVTDQPAAADDAPVQVECPDTPAGRASRALLLGRQGAANHILP